MKKLVTVVIWIFAILVGGIYMSFPSSRMVRDAAKVEKVQENSFQKEYLLYLPDGSFEKRKLEEKESRSEELHVLVQAEFDYLYEKEWEKEKITLKNIYIAEDGVYMLCNEKPKGQSVEAIEQSLKQLGMEGKVQVL
ncbi:hypothetical protein EPT53_03325 [Fusobacterium necrophorum]|uniref:Uncharacterized protein n=1 Tax=Fusobacterium necrophorum TaxID=859 RepID=A0A4Q2KXY4_9FUSO|nr:hypothetical protein [Fusobacterium necrophorum]RXZ70535.1 hypothetical protein EPT53_03325 [Fusobacterium necrophorum]